MRAQVCRHRCVSNSVILCVNGNAHVVMLSCRRVLECPTANVTRSAVRCLDVILASWLWWVR